MKTTDANKAFLPEDILDLVIQPAQKASIAATVATVVPGSGSTFRVPIVKSDPTAAWTAEGADIALSDGDLDEVTRTYKKLAALTAVSNELANDSSPAAAELIGNGLARDLAARLDASFFGTAGSSTIKPAGLEDLTGTGTVGAGTAWTNLDAFTEAVFAAEAEGATLTAFAANPADALVLANLKDEANSNRPLLGTDPTTPVRRTIQGIPLYVSPYIVEGTVWGIPRDRVFVAIRQDATLDIDKSVYFASDRTALRAILRAEFAFPHEAAIQKITLTA